MNQQDEFLRGLIQSLPDIVYKIDPEGNFTFISEAVCKLGYEAGELLGKPFTTIICPEDVNSVRRYIVLPKFEGKITNEHEAPKLFDERRTGKRITKKLRIRMQPNIIGDAGNLPIAEVTATGLYSTADCNQKRFLGTVGIIRDISRIITAEKALILTEKFYRCIIDNSSDIISLLSSDGVILYKSNSISILLGYKPLDMIGESEISFIHNDDRIHFSNMLIDESVPDDSFKFVEHRSLHKDNIWKTLETYIKKIYDENDEIVCIVLYSRDITERKRAENELRVYQEHLEEIVENRTSALQLLNTQLQNEIETRRRTELIVKESEERFRFIFENVKDMIFVLSSDFIVLNASPSVAMILGYIPDVIMGRSIFELKMIKDEYLKKSNYDFTKVLEGNAVDSSVYELICADGSPRFIEASVSPLMKRKNKYDGLILIMRDISERVEIEKIILNEIEIERERIGQNIHDGFGQLFTGIGYLCDLLMKKLKRKSLLEVSDLNEIIKLIGEAKNKTRVFAKGLNPISLDEKSLIDALKEMSLEFCKMFDVSCRIECNEEINIDDKIASTHLYYIAKEAINNAITHGKAKNIIINIIRNKDKIEMSIHDDGCGFKKEEKSRKGLGLLIMSHRARSIGAVLEIRKPDNGGTVVSCIF